MEEGSSMDESQQKRLSRTRAATAARMGSSLKSLGGTAGRRLRTGSVCLGTASALAIGLLHCTAASSGPGSLPTGAVEQVATTGARLLSPSAATASGTQGGAWAALDADPGTRWSSGHQQGGTAGWIMIDMGVAQTFDTITLDSTQHCSNWPDTVDLFVSSDGVNWGSAVATGNGNPSWPTGSGSCPYQETVYVQPSTAQTARYIKLQNRTGVTNNPSNFWSVDGLQVISNGIAYSPTTIYTTKYDIDGVNLSTWYSTSNNEGTYAPSNAIDSDGTSRFSSDYDDGAWFQVDLGSVQSFDTVKIFWETAGALSFSIQSSTDNVNWTTLTVSSDAPATPHDDSSVINTCPAGYGTGSTVNNCAEQDLSVPGSSGRYVRFQGLQRNTEYGYSFWGFQVWSSGSELALSADENVGTISAAETTLSTKRGSAFHLCGWASSAGQKDIDALKASTAWTYDWGDHPGNCVASSADLAGTNPNLEFVPMVWGITNQCRVANALCASGSDCCSGTCTSGACTGTLGGNGSATYITDGVDGGSQNTNLSPSTIVSDIPSNAKYILGFNEPDFTHQSGLTPKQAAAHWADYEYLSTHAGNKAMKIVGPAVNFCDSTCATDNAGCCSVVNDSAVSGEALSSGQREQAFRWLEHFYNECRQTYTAPCSTSADCSNGVACTGGLCTYKGRAGHNCEIDYQAAHSYSWYGIWSVNPLKIKAGSNWTPTVSSSQAHCSNGVKDGDEDGKDCGGENCVACDPNVQKIFAKQLWLTEFAPTTDDCKAADCSTSAQLTNDVTYINNWVAYGGNPGGTNNYTLEKDSFVFRYAWFMPKVTSIASLNACSLLQNVTNVDPTPAVAAGTAYFNAGYSSTCTPSTCTQLGASCGSIGDGCGGTLSCGTCGTGQSCGANNVCACSASAPSNLVASGASSSQNNLSWTASPTSGVTYSVYRSTTSGFTPGSGNLVSSSVSTTSFTDTGLSANTSYYYLVEASVGGCSSGATNQATGTTLSTGLTPYSRTGWIVSSQNPSGAHGGSNLFDNNTSSRWTSNTAQAVGQYFVVEMNASQAFTEVTMDDTHFTSDYPASYTLWGSNDGSTFTQIGSTFTVSSCTSSSCTMTASFSSVTYQYIKVMVASTTSTHWFSVDEFNVLH
jgi:hypothetical protein